MNEITEVAAPQFVFAIRAIPGGSVPEACRARKFLKDLGRRHGLEVSWPEPTPRSMQEACCREVLSACEAGDLSLTPEFVEQLRRALA